MKTLIHLCKKDFTFAKPWILGTWFALAISNLLPWIRLQGEASLPFMMLRLLAPAVMVFLASTRIIHCDRFVGTSGFMGTRPVRATTLLRNKLILIVLVLVLPAVAFAMLNAACLRVRLSPLDCLLLFTENWLYFSLIAGAAVAYSVISRNVSIMVIFIIATPSLFLMLLAMFNLNWPFGKSLEAQHLSASFQLVAQAFLSVAAIAIAISWVAKRRIWLTATGFLLGAAFLVAPGLFWKWNFVDEMSKQAATEEIVSGKAALAWLDKPSLSSNQSRESIPYSQVKHFGRVTGLKDGWVGKLVKFQSEARFSDGTIWTSTGGSEFYPFGQLAPEILLQLGIQVPEDHPMRVYQSFQAWTLFECEKHRLEKHSNRRASIRGTGIFQLSQPCILADMPATAGASVVNGRFDYHLDSVSTFTREISYQISIRGVALASRGDNRRGDDMVEVLFANPMTGKFTNTRGSGGSSSAGGDWISIHGSVSLDQQQGNPSEKETEAFLKDARLYIIGTRYGGNITLPYEIPEMLMEEKH
ncbi:MAG: hypothetical protein ABI600_06080 [Luteolibacter sp.]